MKNRQGRRAVDEPIRPAWVRNLQHPGNVPGDTTRSVDIIESIDKRMAGSDVDRKRVAWFVPDRISKRAAV